MEIQSGPRESKFNEAVLKMQRIDSLQRNINICFTNPLAKDDGGLWAYEILFNSIQSLVSEVYPKLTKPEKEEVKEYIEEAKVFMRTKRLLDKKTNNGWVTSYLTPNENFFEYMDGMQEFDWLVRSYLDTHKLSSPDSYDLTKSIVDM